MSALRVQGACFCQRWESNPHDPKGHGILSPARLPIPPLWLDVHHGLREASYSGRLEGSNVRLRIASSVISVTDSRATAVYDGDNYTEARSRFPIGK